MFFTDTATETTRSYDDAGNLRLSAKVARIGDQDYLGRELGRKPSSQKFTIKREEGEVFKDSFLDSLKDIPITMMPNGSHPPQFVTPANRSKIPVVGHVTTRGSKDGDWVLVDCIIHDQKAIKAIEEKNQMLSLGYDGKAINDSVTDMVANHLSIVKTPRAGQSCKFQDNEDDKMEQPIRLQIGDSIFNVADEDSAKKLTDFYDAMAEKVAESEEDKKKLKDMEKKKAKAEADKDKAESDAKGYKDALDKIQTAETVKLADSFVPKGEFKDCKCALDVKRAALEQTKAYEKNWKDASEAQVEAYFEAAVEAKKEGSQKFGDCVDNMNQKASSSTAYDDYVKELRGEA